jgi:hypothetical protein
MATDYEDAMVRLMTAIESAGRDLGFTNAEDIVSLIVGAACGFAHVTSLPTTILRSILAGGLKMHKPAEVDDVNELYVTSVRVTIVVGGITKVADYHKPERIRAMLGDNKTTLGAYLRALLEMPNA